MSIGSHCMSRLWPILQCVESQLHNICYTTQYSQAYSYCFQWRGFSQNEFRGHLFRVVYTSVFSPLSQQFEHNYFHPCLLLQSVPLPPLSHPSPLQFWAGAMAMPPCGSPRATTWKMSWSTAPPSSPPLDTPRTPGNHVSLSPLHCFKSLFSQWMKNTYHIRQVFTLISPSRPSSKKKEEENIISPHIGGWGIVLLKHDLSFCQAPLHPFSWLHHLAASVLYMY